MHKDYLTAKSLNQVNAQRCDGTKFIQTKWSTMDGWESMRLTTHTLSAQFRSVTPWQGSSSSFVALRLRLRILLRIPMRFLLPMCASIASSAFSYNELSSNSSIQTTVAPGAERTPRSHTSPPYIESIVHYLSSWSARPLGFPTSLEHHFTMDPFVLLFGLFILYGKHRRTPGSPLPPRVYFAVNMVITINILLKTW